MGKQKRTTRTTSSDDRLPLSFPPDLLPPTDHSLRHKALKILCKGSPLYSMPEAGSTAWPQIGVPKKDLAAFAVGKPFTPSPPFVFFRKFILLLVCNDDLLTAFVDSGGNNMRGGDVRAQWHDALQRVLQHTHTSASEDERQQVGYLLEALRSCPEARAIVWRGRCRVVAEHAFPLVMPLAISWVLGYWTLSDASSGFASLVGGGAGAAGSAAGGWQTG
jgi:hypothetical protein